MKVYCVEEVIPCEGSTILAVYDDVIAADRYREDLAKTEKLYVGYVVTEFEVLSSYNPPPSPV